MTAVAVPRVATTVAIARLDFKTDVLPRVKALVTALRVRRDVLDSLDDFFCEDKNKHQLLQQPYRVALLSSPRDIRAGKDPVVLIFYCHYDNASDTDGLVSCAIRLVFDGALVAQSKCGFDKALKRMTLVDIDETFINAMHEHARWPIKDAKKVFTPSDLSEDDLSNVKALVPVMDRVLRYHEFAGREYVFLFFSFFLFL